jgi:hypothetical protein
LVQKWLIGDPFVTWLIDAQNAVCFSIRIKRLGLLIHILDAHIIDDQYTSATRIAMQEHDELDTSETVESWPTIEEIERRLRKLGCTKEQVKRHLDQVSMSRIEAAKEKPKPRSKGRRSALPKDEKRSAS